MAQAASGEPNRFITLTASAQAGIDPAERLKHLSHAWHIVVSRLRRLNAPKTIDYMVIVEATKRGEPHLHILYRGPWVPQAVLAMWMDELIESPICDIRSIHSQREVIRYVAKYVTKQPAQFGTAKRYWSSYAYSDPIPEDPFPIIPPDPPWLVSHSPVSAIRDEFRWRGYRLYSMKPDYMVAVLC